MNKTFLPLAAALLTALLLSGCAPSRIEAPADPGSASTVSALSDPAETPDSSGGGEAPSAPEDDSISVRSIQELVEAVGPAAKIVVLPGRYDLTEYLERDPETADRDAWNQAHPYMQIQEVYDGAELVIRDVPDLCIRGGGSDPAAVELVVEPRYAAVLRFENCTGTELDNMTMGHTEAGDCVGDVLDFAACRDIRLRSMDLYGCGVYGIGTEDGTGDLLVSDSTIRDCSSGTFYLSDCVGAFRFTNCTFIGSGWGGYYDGDDSQLFFVGCSFGQQESNTWYFRDDVSMEDCTFMEPDQYPEYGYEDDLPVFEPERMEQITFTPFMLSSTIWFGYAAVDPQSGDTRYLSLAAPEDTEAEIAYLWLDGEGNGFFEYRGETMDFQWSCMDEETACLQGAEETLYFHLYRIRDESLWALLQYRNELIWFYPY